ncbi:MAG: hypothetical protein M1839_008348 [Geoglossum umbratile]|nr:MAG: hypothetical protein M1839_008348 [Geoglossum umbratile]
MSELQGCFEHARTKFLAEALRAGNLQKNDLTVLFDKSVSIDDVWAAAKRGMIERLVDHERVHSALEKLRPFLEGVSKFAGVIEVAIQIKPGVLAIIWAPLKFLLQSTRCLLEYFDKWIDMVEVFRQSEIELAFNLSE